MRSLARARFLITALLICATGNVVAVERLIRRYDWRTGFPIQSVYNLGQDDRGFLWIAGNALFRYDGREMRRWSGIRGALVPGSAKYGRTSVVDDAQRTVWRVTRSGTAPIVSADGRPIAPVVSAAYGDDGSLWYVPVSAPREVWRLNPEGTPATSPTWSNVDEIVGLRQGGGASIVAITGKSVSRLQPGEPPQTWNLRGVRDVLVRADGTLVMAVNHWSGGVLHGEVLEESGGSFETKLDVPSSRIIELAERGDALWASFDVGLVKIAPDGTTERIGRTDGLESGGPLFVDREGSVWVGTVHGLVQYPEPDTVGWGDVDEDVGRWVTRSSSGETWMAGWMHLLRVAGRPGGWRVRTYAATGSPPCADPGGTVWSASVDLYEFRADREEAVMHRTSPILSGPCGSGPSGLWFAGLNGLLHMGSQDSRPRETRVRPPPLPGPQTWLDAAVEDSDGRLWISRGGAVCHADAKAVAEGTAATWDCEPVPGVRDFNALATTPSGDLWAVVDLNRLLRRAGGRWEPVPAAAELGSSIRAVVPSRSGGFWIVGEELVLRVMERTDLPAGWEIVERLDPWQGLLSLNENWLAEDETGAVWIAGNAGLMYVPTHARRARPAPLHVEVAEILADGRPMDASEEIELPYGHNGLEVKVAAPSFRDPGRIRYRVRLNPRDAWSRASEHPVFRFQHLPSGKHSVEVAASLDGESWVAAGAPISIRVDRPWFLQWSVLAVTLAAAAVLFYGAHRTRVAQLIRLERQRARIAMDLHDEIGSGLGSIGILSELSSRPQMQETRRRELGAEINRVAAALAGSLSDLAGSLRPGAATLESLAQQVSDRAHALFPDGTAEVINCLPHPVPPVRLSLPVRRNVLLVATEVLHNAARHSGASRIELGLAADGRRWRLWVADDGRGFDVEQRTSTPGHGLGLASMRRRAKEIGADLSISAATAQGGGTIVSLVFDPLAEDRRLMG